MQCPNGHETINQVGNCYTCGEPAVQEGSDNADQKPVQEASDNADQKPVLSLAVLIRLKKEIRYFSDAVEEAIKQYESKSEKKE